MILQIDFVQIIADIVAAILNFLNPIVSPMGSFMVYWMEYVLQFFPQNDLILYISIAIVIVVLGLIVNILWPGDKKPGFLVKAEEIDEKIEKKAKDLDQKIEDKAQELEEKVEEKVEEIEAKIKKKIKKAKEKAKAIEEKAEEIEDKVEELEEKAEGLEEIEEDIEDIEDIVAKGKPDTRYNENFITDLEIQDVDKIWESLTQDEQKIFLEYIREKQYEKQNVTNSLELLKNMTTQIGILKVDIVNEETLFYEYDNKDKLKNISGKGFISVTSLPMQQRRQYPMPLRRFITHYSSTEVSDLVKHISCRR